MCTIKVTVARSAEWVTARRLESGTNTPERITVDVPISGLSLEARKILLAAFNGGYPSEFKGNFDQLYQFSGYSTYGVRSPIVDAESPTVEQIDAAILAANAALAEKRAAYQAEKSARQAKQEAEQQAEEQRKQKLAEARNLLAAELKELAEVKDDRRVLAEFLAKVPQDALRGTLKRMASSESAIADLEKKVEDASPVVIFDEDSDD
jgi:hypothetical protein